jgi:hypothetical protein
MITPQTLHIFTDKESFIFSKKIPPLELREGFGVGYFLLFFYKKFSSKTSKNLSIS